MATLTVRDLPDDVRDKLRIRAAQNGRSMEAEVRAVLAGSVEEPVPARRRTKAEWDETVRSLQAAFAPYRDPGNAVVDEMIAERRAEAEREGPPERRTAHAVLSQREKLERARAVVRQYVPEGRSLVDEFLAERRAMWDED